MSQLQKHATETSSLMSRTAIGQQPTPRTKGASSSRRTIVFWMFTAVLFYLISGVSQPLLVSLAKNSGLADPKAQLYMVFYYFGPASVGVSVCLSKEQHQTPPNHLIWKAVGIAIFDLMAQTINYTGSTLSGPTLFALIYSSVTVWTAMFSRRLLKRRMNEKQWFGVFVVFGGLTITACDAVSLGPSTVLGSIMVMIGSSMHALTYVMNEAILTRHQNKLSVQLNCAIQGIVACLLLLMWQLVYTRKHYEELILQPVRAANTTWQIASLILLGLTFANLVHSLSYFFTLKHVTGGATSAGVLKGLQAVLVFVVSSVLFCGRLGGEEMCFSTFKLASLIVVVAGVVLFGHATEQQRKRESEVRRTDNSSTPSGYEVI